jgi:hypothetical protein
VVCGDLSIASGSPASTYLLVDSCAEAASDNFHYSNEQDIYGVQGHELRRAERRYGWLSDYGCGLG